MSQARNTGYIESSQRLVQPAGREWNQRELLAAAQHSEQRNTGWPIGLVLQGAGLAPVATPAGIEARLERYGSGQPEDFWSLHKDGHYYVSRLFEEDFEAPPFASSEGHPERSVWVDLRILRITEVLLHSAALYRELRVPPDEPYLLTVNHRGLQGREFYVSTPTRFVRRGRICRSPEATWTREVTEDYVASNLNSLVGDASDGLFVLFDFAQVSRQVVDDLVDGFLQSRF